MRPNRGEENRKTFGPVCLSQPLVFSFRVVGHQLVRIFTEEQIQRGLVASAERAHGAAVERFGLVERGERDSLRHKTREHSVEVVVVHGGEIGRFRFRLLSK